MNTQKNLILFGIHHPKLVLWGVMIMTLVLGTLISRVKVDTDPENMLSEDEAVRVFHNQTKKEFDLHDVVVLGVVNETHPDGVFNPATLEKVHLLTEYAKTLAHPEHPEKRVVAKNLIAPGTVDAIVQAGPGQVKFDWLMAEPPKTRAEALKIRRLAMDNPLLNGTVVSENGKALALYIPITEKDFAYHVRESLLEKVGTFNGDEKYHITGLPVAEDTFGVEMFVQMAVSAPMAMVAIFLLMWFFFKNIRLIISPMIIAMATVISTMGLLIGTGNTVHIMSSMIPIFLMPIAVVDSIHILSEFFDLYRKLGERRKTLRKVMNHLFMPMLYTSLTSATGFASLALTPIPPVRVFGLFVAFGIVLAWLLTILFIPAYIILLSDKALDNLGKATERKGRPVRESWMSKHLKWVGINAYTRSKTIVFLSTLVIAASMWGITKIQINDNPVNWFEKNHEIRVADRVLNKHFGGTYEAFLVLENAAEATDVSEAVDQVTKTLKLAFANDTALLTNANGIVQAATKPAPTREAFFKFISDAWDDMGDTLPDSLYDTWQEGLDAVNGVKNSSQIFKRPDVLRYIEKLEAHLALSGTVGKSNSLSDIVKKVHQELFEGKSEYYSVPATINGVAQTLISVQNSHKPEDLWHLVTPDYQKSNIWVQLKKGDNKDMESTIAGVETFFRENPPPVPLKHNWAGLTYLNVVWQDKMVSGMLNSFLSSFLVVLVLMTILFRSPLWGLLAMVPLSMTIAMIYGLIGFIGKDYDMPVAVLSSLTLGLAIDFAIHFLERARETYKELGDWKAASKQMFEEPARAIARNVIVIAIGFTPLLLAPLVPYQTVGIFLATIMAVSGIATMWVLPSLIRIFQRWLFKAGKSKPDGADDVKIQPVSLEKIYNDGKKEAVETI